MIIKYDISELEEIVSNCEDMKERIEDLKYNIKYLADELSNETTPKIVGLFDEILSFDIEDFGSKVEEDISNYQKTIQEVIDNAIEVDSDVLKMEDKWVILI